MTCAPSEDSDQPGHSPSVIRSFIIEPLGPKVARTTTTTKKKKKRTAKAQIRLGGYPGPGRSESSLGAQVLVCFVVLRFINLYQDLKKVTANLPQKRFFVDAVFYASFTNKTQILWYSSNVSQFYYPFPYPCYMHTYKTHLKETTSNFLRRRLVDYS